MQYISSDTNVWIDFYVISKLDLPFRLPYAYIMYEESIDGELLNPPNLSSNLREAGLIGVEITTEEFFLADSWGNIYKKLSTPDRIALSIAKTRNIVLLTGDRALRNAAKNEGVSVIGTIGLLDQLYEKDLIDKREAIECLTALLDHNGREVRLPEKELRDRIDRLKS